MSIDVKPRQKGIKLSPEIEAFCARMGITAYVGVMIGIIEESFPTAHDLSLEAECDPESGEEWLIVNATVTEEVNDFMIQYHQYTEKKIAAIPISLNDKLCLSWHFSS